MYSLGINANTIPKLNLKDTRERGQFHLDKDLKNGDQKS